MKSQKFWIMTLTVVAAIVLGVYLWQTYLGPKEPPPLVVEKKPVPEKPQVPTVLHPLPPAPKAQPPVQQEKPLPALNNSDSAVQENLGRLFPRIKLAEVFILNHFIQRFVVMVDNLPRHQLPANRLPTQPAPGHFQVANKNGEQVINPENYRRYAPYVQLAENVDTEKLVAFYTHFYPLFQKAYEKLGYPHGYFNDRLVEVIDQLLDTPKVSEPIRVVQPGIRYQYADPKLESLGAGQKILIRMGPENSAKVKAKLEQIRQALTTRPPQS